MNPCVISSPTEKTLGPRLKMLLMPSGQTLILIGQNHGDRLGIRKLLSYANYKDDSDDLWLWTLDSVKRTNKKAFSEAAEETDFLKDFLQKNSDIKNIGLEMTPETITDHMRYSRTLQSDLLNESSRRKLKAFSSSDYVLGFSGSLTYLFLTSPGLFKNRNFFGFEDSKESEAHALSVEKVDSAMERLSTKIDASTLEGQSALQILYETNKDFLKLYPQYNSDKDPKILATVLSKFPDAYKNQVSEYISASLGEMKKMKQRDQKIAEALLGQKGSVIATIGSAHLENVMLLVQSKCQSDLKTLASSKKTPFIGKK